MPTLREATAYTEVRRFAYCTGNFKVQLSYFRVEHGADLPVGGVEGEGVPGVCWARENEVKGVRSFKAARSRHSLSPDNGEDAPPPAAPGNVRGWEVTGTSRRQAAAHGLPGNLWQ